MASDEPDVATPFDDESRTIGIRLYNAMASVSEVAHDAEVTAENNGDPTGEWSVSADRLWQIKASLESIMRDLGVKTPDDLRRIQMQDYPAQDGNDQNEDLPF